MPEHTHEQLGHIEAVNLKLDKSEARQHLNSILH
jgi:hypothetical protein